MYTRLIAEAARRLYPRGFDVIASRHGRRVFRRDDGLEIKSPDQWKAKDYAIRAKNEVYCGPVSRHSAGLIQAANFSSAVAF
jgi:hypothetical protein